MAKSARPAESRGELARFILLLALATLALRAFVVTPFHIPTSSMLPALHIGDYLFVSKWPYGYSRFSLPFAPRLWEGRFLAQMPARGDIAVFRGPDSQDYIKRVIGLPGDMVQMRGGVLYLNGAPVAKRRMADFRLPLSANTDCRAHGAGVSSRGSDCRYPRFRERPPGARAFEVLDHGRVAADDTGVFLVPEGHLFMMGDNRDDSLDSRFTAAEGGVDLVPTEALIGRAEMLFFSTDGSASLVKPWTWFSATRWGRIGTGL